ncbi:MAG: Hsp33 family molecular chaperone [Alphaproteobacteria bacterium]|nr:Hsp33 family molecular chaperone [Alphaproteobacteria bacterium]
MAQAELTDFGLDRPESGDDVAVPFTLEALDCRGRVVRLGPALDAILRRHDYPEPVSRLLGEAIVLTALIGSSLKYDGKFILQTNSEGPVSMIVVDLDAPDGLRACAKFDAAAVDAATAAGRTSPADLLGTGHLAMTVDQGTHMDRYQGIVALEGDGFEVAARHYFLQSEQIPTEVRLAVAEHAKRGDRPRWRAEGMLVQYLPRDGKRHLPDLPGDGDFDNPETADPHFAEPDGWTEAKALLATLGDAELVDPDVSSERLLFRLFHETRLRLFDAEPLEERCSCSAERIEDMLMNNFTAEERRDMAVNGEIEVTCEFCSTAYHFSPGQFEPKN